MEAEFTALERRTSDADLRPLIDAGVNPAMLQNLGTAISPVLLSRDGQFWQPGDDADGVAHIVPLRIGNPNTPEAIDPALAICAGHLIDLLAISPKYPERWALRTGNATWAGAVSPQMMAPEPVPIWRTPLHWLGNDCRGLALLSRDRRDQYRILTMCDAILA